MLAKRTIERLAFTRMLLGLGGDEPRNDLRAGKYIRTNEFIANSRRCLSQPTSNNSMNIWNEIQSINLPMISTSYQTMWTASFNGEFSINLLFSASSVNLPRCIGLISCSFLRV